METLDNLKQEVMSQSYDSAPYNYSIHKSEARNARAESENERRFNFEQSQLDKLFTIQMKDYEDAYNSPAAQKARFLAAGINPYLAMYGGASNQTGQTSSPASHGSSGSGAAAQASAGSAEAARLGAIVGAAGQFNDSVGSYYKNLITNEQAKQEKFKTETMAQDYVVGLQSRISELRSKRHLNQMEEYELRFKENELEDYYKTREARNEQPVKQNLVLEEQANDLKKAQQLKDRQIVSLDVHDAIDKAVARSNIRVNEQTVNQLEAATEKLWNEASLVANENEIKGAEVRRIAENWNAYVQEWYDQKIITHNQAKQMKIATKKAEKEYANWCLTHGFDPNTDKGVEGFWYWLISRANEAGSVVGTAIGSFVGKKATE